MRFYLTTLFSKQEPISITMQLKLKQVDQLLLKINKDILGLNKQLARRVTADRSQTTAERTTVRTTKLKSNHRFLPVKITQTNPLKNNSCTLDIKVENNFSFALNVEGTRIALLIQRVKKTKVVLISRYNLKSKLSKSVYAMLYQKIGVTEVLFEPPIPVES